MIEKTLLPPKFAAVEYLALWDWNGDPDSPNVKSLVEWIQKLALSLLRNDTPGGESSAPHRSTPPLPDPIPRQSGVSKAGRLFICYRREDTPGEAGRLHDFLTGTFGADAVIMDVDSVPLGIDFVDHISEQIGQCKAVVVMIGRQWLTMKDKRRRRRLDDPEDLVRLEIAAALQLKVPVIPVLVQNAHMPDREDLPEGIRLLARRNGVSLRHDQWHEGVERLVKDLKAVIGRTTE
jgi:hypothetical protein